MNYGLGGTTKRAKELRFLVIKELVLEKHI